MIPKIIHFCWISNDPYPENIQKCINSWKEKLPDYEIKLWNKDCLDFDSNIWLKQALECKKYAFIADFVRFYALYNYGGIYLDSDVEVLKTFNEFLNNQSFMCFEYLNFPEAAIIGAEKGLPWVKRCLDYYKDRPFLDEFGNQNKDVAPLLVKLAVEKELRIKLSDTEEIQYFNTLTMYPYWYFSPKNFYTDEIKVKPETVAIHRFASAWNPDQKHWKILKLHDAVIKLIGKKNHDRLFRKIKKWPDTFNGEKI